MEENQEGKGKVVWAGHWTEDFPLRVKHGTVTQML